MQFMMIVQCLTMVEMMSIHSGKELLRLKMDSLCDVEISNHYFCDLNESRPFGNTFCGEYYAIKLLLYFMKFLVVIFMISIEINNHDQLDQDQSKKFESIHNKCDQLMAWLSHDYSVSSNRTILFAL